MAVFWARGLRKGDAMPEEDEFITTRLVPLPQALRMATHGVIRDAKTIASILWLERKLRT